MRKILNVCAAFCLLQPVLLAGVKLQMEITKPGKTPKYGWMYIDGSDKLRMDSEAKSPQGQPENTVIYRADQDVIYIVSHDEKKYMRMDKETIAEMSSKMNDAMQKLEAQLKQMPPEQRAMMEKMMKGRMPKTAEKRTLVVKPAGSEGGLRKYEVWLGKEKESEVWVSDPGKVGISAENMAVFQKMSTLFESLVQSLARNPYFNTEVNPFEGFKQMDGFPVRIKDKDGEVTVIRNASQQSLNASLFEVPSGYQEQNPFKH